MCIGVWGVVCFLVGWLNFLVVVVIWFGLFFCLVWDFFIFPNLELEDLVKNLKKVLKKWW